MADDKKEEASEDEDVAAAEGDDAAEGEASGENEAAGEDSASAEDSAAGEDEVAARESGRHRGRHRGKQEGKTEGKGDDGGEGKVGRKFSWWWLLPAAMLVEFYIYGRHGYIDVCVGKEGQTDFTLVGKARTDDNRWKFPRCERRTNLGLRSTYDEKLADGVKVACRQATLFRNQGEAAQCETAEGGWVHQVDTSFCPPWDPNYYKHLFWFLQ